MFQAKIASTIAPIVALCLAAASASAAQPAACLAAASASAAQPAAPVAGDFYSAITGGKAKMNFRYRVEMVEQDPFARDATASTLLSRLNYLTGEWQGLRAFFEVDNVTVLGDEDSYNSTVNGIIDRPVIADPEYTEVNQAYVEYKAGDFTAIIGRQRIVLDNSRFIANVVWRQNEQTYDAITVRSAAVPRTQLQYSYIDNVNRVFGPDDGAHFANFRSNSHVFNGRVDLGLAGALTGFAYLLDFDNAPWLSSGTYGVHWTGSHKLAIDRQLNWMASYASQVDHGDNPTNFTADYFVLEGGAVFGSVGFRAGYEVLGGDTRPGRAFQTPLATLHAFNGWADQFLTTPVGGLENFYVGGSARVGPVALQLIWHDFKAEATDRNYGTEWNGIATIRFGAKNNYEAMLKFADYQTDGFAADTTKIWTQFSAAF